jgi:hypothetical protein
MKGMNDRYRRGLHKECGSTDTSLENARRLVTMIGHPALLEFIGGGDSTQHKVTATWQWPGKDNFEHTFSGFAWGFGGRGPHGLAEFLAMIGGARALDLNQIIHMNQKATGHVLILARRGKSWLRIDGPALKRETEDADKG